MKSTHIERRVQTVIQAEGHLGTVINAEPVILEFLKLAASQDDRAHRWHLYEVLKDACSWYIGRHAANPELRDPIAYEHVIQALDLLLPMPMIEKEATTDDDQGASLQHLRDAVIRLCPQIHLPERPEERYSEGEF